jgi:acetyl-CoA carboxylase biotin carboxylase subunit
MYEGWTVPIDYDPMLAKLISYGSDRAQAIARLRRALDGTFVGGIKNNLQLFQRIVRDDDFKVAKFDTGYLDRLLQSKPGEGVRKGDSHKDADVAAIAAGLFVATELTSAGNSNGGPSSDLNRKSEAFASGWKKAARLEALQ